MSRERNGTVAILVLVVALCTLPIGVILGFFLGMGNILNGGKYIRVDVASELALMGVGILVGDLLLCLYGFRLLKRP
jgi:hypothetical protein